MEPIVIDDIKVEETVECKRIDEMKVMEETIACQRKQPQRCTRRSFFLLGGSLILALLVSLAIHFTSRVEEHHPHHHHHGHFGAPCHSPFGSFVGSAMTVNGFSNCNGEYASGIDNFVDVKDPMTATVLSVFTGMQWQCVEYARRFLILHFSRSFVGVVGASDIWPLTTVFNIFRKNESVPFLSFPNGESLSPPAIGDLIIYPIQGVGFEFGHVAVVVSVGPTSIFIAEENWSNAKWPGNYSRELTLSVLNRTKFRVSDDPYLIDGWKRVSVKKKK